MPVSLSIKNVPDAVVKRLRRRAWTIPVQVLALLVLAPVCAEYLSAYDDSTGDPGRLLVGLLFLSPLYGGAALIIREVARRAGLGWIGMILMAAAFGLFQAGVIDQSLFSVNYRGIASWEASLRSTFIAPLGFSAVNALNFIGGHVIYSICGPIALVEAFRPARRTTPWLGRAGIVLAATLYCAVSAVILKDHLANESSHASMIQVVASLFVAGGLVVGAYVLGRRRRPKVDRRAPRPRTVFLAGLVAAVVLSVVPENWLGAALSSGILVISAMGVARVSRASDWDARHTAALAAGAVLSRALEAFTYFPLIGDVSATRKYLHNAVFLALIVGVSLLAAWRANSRRTR